MIAGPSAPWPIRPVSQRWTYGRCLSVSGRWRRTDFQRRVFPRASATRDPKRTFTLTLSRSRGQQDGVPPDLKRRSRLAPVGRRLRGQPIVYVRLSLEQRPGADDSAIVTTSGHPWPCTHTKPMRRLWPSLLIIGVQIHHLKDKDGNTDVAGATPAKLITHGAKLYKYVDHASLGQWIEAAAKAAGKWQLWVRSFGWHPISPIWAVLPPHSLPAPTEFKKRDPKLLRRTAEQR